MSHELAMELAAGFVLGALEPAEEAAVREHLLTCRLSHEELADLGGVVGYLAESVEQVEPPPALRDRIMAAAAADLAGRGAGGEAASALAPQAPGPAAAPLPATPFPGAAERAERTARRRPSQLDWALRIAAVVAIVVLGGWNLLLQGQLSNAQAFDRAVAAVIDAGGKPGSQTVVLSPQPGSTARGIGAVAPDGSVIIAMRDLPPTAGTQVYEAWVITGASVAPVPVGGFTVGSNGTAAFTTEPVPTPAGSTIALSLEPSPGSTAPRGSIVAAGVSTGPRT